MNDHNRKSLTSLQMYKLACKEGDWKLPGTATTATLPRTRSGSKGRPNPNKKLPLELSSDESDHGGKNNNEEAPFEIVDDSSSSEWEDEPEEEESEEEEDEVEEQAKKPNASRVIVETNALTDILVNNCRCSVCGSAVKVEYNTICIATSIEVICENEVCGYIYHSHVRAIANIGYSKNRERNTDYAINIQYVLGFLTSGDGGVEAARLLGVLGLPNDTTMETRSFPTIEERISPFIQQLSKDILLENLVEEARLSFPDENDFKLWRLALTDKTIVLTHPKYARIDCSFDMGWQQRSSGNRYASPSGDALLVGSCTRKPISMMIKSKLCNYCKTWKKNKNNDGVDPPEHDCKKNHDGSSSAMEPEACLDMVTDLHNSWCVIVARICADDDASTRSLLRWSNADHMTNTGTTTVPKVLVTRGPNKGVKQQDRPDRGRLPGNIPEPVFVADPNHRKKVFTGDLYALKTSKVAERFTMSMMDVTRLGKNFGYMVRNLKKRPESEWEDASKAVLEHHFDNHTHCGRWCPRLRMTQAQRDAGGRYYRCKTKDAKLYAKLQQITSRFVSIDRLRKVAHGMDTQINESFNNTASWFAPKNKVYCGSQSLSNRLSLAVGINSIGMEQYFVRLFRVLKISMPPDIHHFLVTKQNGRQRRREKRKLNQSKKDRVKRKYLKLAEDEACAKRDAAKRAGTYKKGQNMAEGGADGYTLDDLLAKATDKPQRKQRKVNKNAVCPLCKLPGHTTKRSSACLFYKKLVPKGQAKDDNPTEEEADASAAADLDDYEAMDINNDDVSIGSLALYEDAGTWTDDEDAPPVGGI
jgi:hypothetical protein